MLEISKQLQISESEIQLQSIRSQGNGGQNVNKVSTAIHLRFDIHASSLPQSYKEKLLLLDDRRLTRDGIIIIKARNFRSREKNRKDALNRLIKLLAAAAVGQKKRKATQPTLSAKMKRLKSKSKRGLLKKSRGKVLIEE